MLPALRRRISVRPRLLQRSIACLLVSMIAALPVFPLTLMAAAITISPTTATLTTGGTRQFTAHVTGVANTAVIWKVNDITGGNASVGRIDGTGKYTAPAVKPRRSAG